MSRTWQSVRSSQLNSSPSKATHAFPRDNRFKETYRATCDSFYNIPSSLGKAPACGIGSGSKQKLVGNLDTPSPQKYDIKSTFNGTFRGGKFALGREVISAFILQAIKHNGVFNKSETPEPSRYNIKGTLDSRGSSIHSKLKQNEPSYMKAPGPGHYSSVSVLNSTGKYIVSGFTNCPGPKIIKGKTYDPEAKKKVPGPGHYEHCKENLNESGSYFNSKHESSNCRSFSKGSRIQGGIFRPTKLPGPGAYNFFSQFGAGRQ